MRSKFPIQPDNASDFHLFAEKCSTTNLLCSTWVQTGKWVNTNRFHWRMKIQIEKIIADGPVGVVHCCLGLLFGVTLCRIVLGDCGRLNQDQGNFWMDSPYTSRLNLCLLFHAISAGFEKRWSHPCTQYQKCAPTKKKKNACKLSSHVSVKLFDWPNQRPQSKSFSADALSSIRNQCTGPHHGHGEFSRDLLIFIQNTGGYRFIRMWTFWIPA